MSEEGELGAGEGEQKDQGPAPEIIIKAKDMGWAPKEQFRGDPDRWVDAEEFVRKGEEVLPIVRAQLRTTTGRLTEAERENQKLQANLTELRESVAAMQQIQTREAIGRTDRQIKSIRTQIEEARGDRDVDKVVALQETLDALVEEKTKLGVAPEKAGERDDDAPPKGDPRIQAEIREWNVENPWFGKDRIRTRMMNAMAPELTAELAAEGKKLVGKAFLSELASRVEAEYTEAFPDDKLKFDKTGGGSQSGSRSGSSGTKKGKSFSDLPTDAQTACNQDISRLVGPNKVYKTKEDYQKFYVTEYFGDEA